MKREKAQRWNGQELENEPEECGKGVGNHNRARKNRKSACSYSQNYLMHAPGQEQETPNNISETGMGTSTKKKKHRNQKNQKRKIP